MDFVINPEGELQLQAQSESPSFLYVQPQIPTDAIWEFSARLTFSPSNSNKLEWVLQSTSSSLDALSGYGLQIGESGSEDAVEFVRYDNGNVTVLGRMREGAVGEDPVQLSMQVERIENEFTLRAAYDGESEFSDSLTVVDGAYGGGAELIFGPICNFTSTRSDRFFFDDVIIERSTPDTEAPIRRETTVSSDRIDIKYNERIDISSVDADLSPGSFSLEVEFIEPATLRLIPSPEISPQTAYTLQISGIKDVSGNTRGSDDIPIFFIDARGAMPFEVILNELMIAPGDETPLPNEEYYELYNRSNDYLDLGNLFVVDETSMAAIPAYNLAPDSFLILCDQGDGLLFEPYGDVLEVPGLPTLRNSNDRIWLMDSENRFIHGIDYTDNWYKDSNKDRGWSLELIHPDFVCSEEIAYAASIGSLGGTPGKANSLDTTGIRDPLTPQFVRIDDLDEIKVEFNQWLPATGITKEMLSVNPTDIQIRDVIVDVESPRRLRVQLDRPLKRGIQYRLEFFPTFIDCRQMAVGTLEFVDFGLPATPESGELLISEVMFNPSVGEAQWVEIYNNSDSIFNFEFLVLDVFKANGQDRLTINRPNPILPGEYFVLTDNRNQVIDVYDAPFPTQVLEVPLPSLDRNQGELELLYIFGAEASRLDSSCYVDEWHSGFLRSERGVSLERTRWDLSGCEQSNWQSAAESENFGTPTGPNSQQVDIPGESVSGFQLLSPTFSPNSDGIEDIAIVRYIQQDDQQPLPRITFSVYRPDGQLVKEVHNNFGLSRNAQLVWDGSQSDGLIAPEGFYLLHIKSFDDEGRRNTWKATVYLVR